MGLLIEYKEFLIRLNIIDCEMAKLMYSLYLNMMSENERDCSDKE